MTNPRGLSGVAGDTLSNPINSTADSSAGVLDVYSGMSFIYSMSEEITQSVIEVLQDFFMAYPLGRAFNESLAEVNKSVIIKDTYSMDSQQLPAIVVQSVPAEHVPVSLGNKQGTESYNDKDYITYSGLVNIATSLNIYDSGKPNVSKLADIVFLAFMHYVPVSLNRRYLFPQPQVRFTNPVKQTGTNLGGDVFMNTLNVSIMGNWHQYFEVDAPELAEIRQTITKPSTSR